MLLKLWLSSTKTSTFLIQAHLLEVRTKHSLKALLHSLQKAEEESQQGQPGHTSRWQTCSVAAAHRQTHNTPRTRLVATPNLWRNQQGGIGGDELRHTACLAARSRCSPLSFSLSAPMSQPYHTKAGPSAAPPGRPESKDPEETEEERWQRRSKDAAR